MRRVYIICVCLVCGFILLVVSNTKKCSKHIARCQKKRQIKIVECVYVKWRKEINSNKWHKQLHHLQSSIIRDYFNAWVESFQSFLFRSSFFFISAAQQLNYYLELVRITHLRSFNTWMCNCLRPSKKKTLLFDI